MGYRFSKRSLDRLGTCHPDLVKLMTEAILDPACPSDLTVLCGHRGEKEQNAAFDAGRSKLRYPRSKHNGFPSLAVDVAPYIDGAVSWDWEHYYPLADHIRATWDRLEAAGALSGSFVLVWGGTGKTLRDGPHFEIRAR